jgi:hypothetical protein
MHVHEPERSPASPRRTSRATSHAGSAAARITAWQRAAGNASVTRALSGGDRSDGATGPRPSVPDVVRSPGRPLAPQLRAEMEARLGADFAGVRVHSGSAAARSAADLGATAYTTGEHVVVGAEGLDRHTLAHELTHVVQQRAGPVSGTDRGDGLSVSDPGDRFERAAEANAIRVMRAGVPATPHDQREGTPPAGAAGGVRAAVQRYRSSVKEVADADPATPPPPALARAVEDLESLMVGYDRVQVVPSPTGTGQVPRKRPDLDVAEVTRMVRALEAVSEVGGPEADGWREENRAWLRRVGKAIDEEMWADVDQDLDYAYHLMSFGRIWNDGQVTPDPPSHPPFAHFERISAETRAGLEEEIAGRRGGGDAGPPGVRSWGALQTALERSLRTDFVLRHYLPAERLALIYREGAENGAGSPAPRAGTLKSAATMNTEKSGHPDDFARTTENSGTYNAENFGNHGFVFFYLERESAGFRESRFGDTRITADVGRIRERRGWAMLADFRGREFPTQRHDGQGAMLAYPGAHGTQWGTTKNPTPVRPSVPHDSVAPKSPEGRVIRAVNGIQQQQEKAWAILADMSSGRRAYTSTQWQDMRDELSRVHRELERLQEERARAGDDSRTFSRRSRQFVATEDREAATDFSGHLAYYGPVPDGAANHPANVAKRRRPMPSSKNVLVGGDVLPGIAQFLVVELATLWETDRAAATVFLRMAPGDLVDAMLRSSIRPQVMLPETFEFTAADVTHRS